MLKAAPLLLRRRPSGLPVVEAIGAIVRIDRAPIVVSRASNVASGTASRGLVHRPMVQVVILVNKALVARPEYEAKKCQQEGERRSENEANVPTWPAYAVVSAISDILHLWLDCKLPMAGTHVDQVARVPVICSTWLSH